MYIQSKKLLWAHVHVHVPLPLSVAHTYMYTYLKVHVYPDCTCAVSNLQSLNWNACTVLVMQLPIPILCLYLRFSVGTTPIDTCSSVGRASVRSTECRRFESHLRQLSFSFFHLPQVSFFLSFSPFFLSFFLHLR